MCIRDEPMRSSPFTHLCLAGALLLLSGCVSLSTYQSPRVLDPGESHLGAGVMLGAGGAGVGEFAVLGRRGVAEGFDLGAKVWGVPPFLGIYGDVRSQLQTEPFLVSGTLGASFFSVRQTVDGEETGTSTTALYPAVLIGSDRLFAGARWTQLFGSAGDLEERYGLGFPGVILGASFGSRVSVAPEVNVHFGDDVLVLPGAALIYRF